MALHTSTLSILSGSAAVLLLAGAVAAQNIDTGTSRADTARTQTELTPNEATTGGISTSDPDMGEHVELNATQQRYQPFTVAVAEPIYWTSNAFLSRTDERSDIVQAPGAAIYYQPRITSTIFGLIDVRDQQFYYNRFDELNFGDFAVDAGINMTVPQMDNLILRAQYTYDRLTKRESFSAFFENHAIILNAEVPVKLTDAQQLAFGIATTLSARSIPESVRRNDYEAYVGYSIALTRAISVAASGRLTVRDYYHENSRVDMSELGALSASCALTRFITVSALSTFAANQSNQSFADFKVGNVGGSFVLGIKF